MLENSRAVRSATLFGYVDLALAAGLDLGLQLKKAGLSLQLLSDPECWLPAESVIALLENSAQVSGLEDFGLRLASRRRLANLGAISVVLREEATALAAMRTLERYRHLVNPALLLQIELGSTLVIIREDVAMSAMIPIRQGVEMAVGILARLLHELLGPSWRPRQVAFMHRAPKNTRNHLDFFGIEPDFESEFNGLVCDRRILETELPNRDRAIAQMARLPLERALKGTMLQPDRSLGARSGLLKARLEDLLTALLPSGMANAAVAAQHLGMDRRTLHRHLQKMGLSHSKLLDEVRLKHALRLLRETDHSVARLAPLLGFSESSGFAHWFKRVTGKTAGAWRSEQAVKAN